MSDISGLIGEMTATAAALLESLSTAQRERVSLAFDDEETRRAWYYTPTPRAGLPLGEMTARQQQTVRRLMASGLSTPGFNSAATTMGLEWMVDQWSAFPDRTYGDLPDTVIRDPANYCVAVFGAPGDRAPWAWRIGGHHLNLHFTLHDGFVSPTPAFFGAEPARVAMPGGVIIRALAAEEDLARDLLLSLNAAQRARAVLSEIAATDIVQTNRPRIEDGALYQIGGGGPGGQGLRDKLGLTPEHDERLRYSLAPKGLPAGEMAAGQRETLSRLIGAYFEHLAAPIAAHYAALLAPEKLAATAFAWAGSDEFASPHYYRIQGERLLIEYDCTQNDSNHTHSVWRDPLGDFGDDVLAGHYATAHKGQ